MHTTNDFLYVLHFNSALAHAKHYTGSTLDLINRIETHAKGRGSAITQAIIRSQGHFKLGGLYAARPGVNIRHVEARLKKHANGPRFCTLCNTAAADNPPGGTIDAPEQIKKHISDLLKKHANDMLSDR